MIHTLTNAGANLDKKNKFGYTALMLTTHMPHEHTDMIIYALTRGGADVNKIWKDGLTTLMFASQNKDKHAVAMIRALTNAGANVKLPPKATSSSFKLYIGFPTLSWYENTISKS